MTLVRGGEPGHNVGVVVGADQVAVTEVLETLRELVGLLVGRAGDRAAVRRADVVEFVDERVVRLGVLGGAGLATGANSTRARSLLFFIGATIPASRAPAQPYLDE